MTIEDIATLSPKFWAIHTDMVLTADPVASATVSIHWNLVMGTVARYAPTQPDLLPILQSLERFDVVGSFMLTELAHGLDARNIETTATQQPDGTFDLHTPSASAAKVMPPSTPHAGMPRLAVVFAQLTAADGRRPGPRAFVVPIHDGAGTMMAGVTSRLLPPRMGAAALDHAVTTFAHVRLPAAALLGGTADGGGGGGSDDGDDARASFNRQIARVTVGTLALTMTNVVTLRMCGYIAGRYSQRRTTAGRVPGERVPIVEFATQHRPVLAALVFAEVFDAYAGWSVKGFMGEGSGVEDPRVRAGLAAVFKGTVVAGSLPVLHELMERCGWQGLFGYNQMSNLVMTQRGISIAEGDVMVLCIRLVSELLLGRYALPKASDPTSLLARHEAGVWEEARTVLEEVLVEDGSHRKSGFNSRILPWCRDLVRATGQRMAYEAAKTSPGITQEALRFYETSCVLEDPSWYVEHKVLSRMEMMKLNSEATNELLPLLDGMLEKTGASRWATAIISDEGRWDSFIKDLHVFHDYNGIGALNAKL